MKPGCCRSTLLVGKPAHAVGTRLSHGSSKSIMLLVQGLQGRRQDIHVAVSNYEVCGQQTCFET